MTVFISSENSTRDYSAAGAFGETHFINYLELSRTSGSSVNREIMSNIREAAHRFDPQQDYLVLTGDPLQIGLVFTAFAEKAKAQGFKHMAILKWNNRSNKYLQYTVELP